MTTAAAAVPSRTARLFSETKCATRSTTEVWWAAADILRGKKKGGESRDYGRAYFGQQREAILDSKVRVIMSFLISDEAPHCQPPGSSALNEAKVSSSISCSLCKRDNSKDIKDIQLSTTFYQYTTETKLELH